MELEKVVVGDWSYDGHGNTRMYHIQVPCKFDTRKAYEVGREVVGFDIKKQCSDYDDSNFHKEVYDAVAVAAAKYDVVMHEVKYYDEGDDEPVSYLSPEDFFHLWLVVVNIGKQVLLPGSPPIAEMQITSRSTHNIGGYGLFDD